MDIMETKESTYSMESGDAAVATCNLGGEKRRKREKA